MLVFEEWRKPEYIVPEEKPRRARREPTTNSTHNWRHRQDLCLGHTGGSTSPPLLPIIENKWLSLLNHRSHSTPQRRLRRPASVPKPITFYKVTNKHQTIFLFSVKTIARNFGKMYHSLTAGHLQLDESVRLKTLVIRCFFTSSTSLQVTFSFSQEKRSREALFSHHHKFCAPKTNKTKAEPRHHPSVLRVNFHHRLNVTCVRKFCATV